MAVSAVPIKTVWGNYSNQVKPNVVPADPDIVLVNPDSMPVDLMADMILQNIGGTELIKSVRHDMVNGQKVAYRPIVNLDALAVEFSPITITGFVPTLRNLKENFEIRIDDLFIETANGSGPIFVGTDSNGKAYIIVELDNLQDSDVVELATAVPTQQSLFEYHAVVNGGIYEDWYSGEVDGGDHLGYNIDTTVNGGDF